MIIGNIGRVKRREVATELGVAKERARTIVRMPNRRKLCGPTEDETRSSRIADTLPRREGNGFLGRRVVTILRVHVHVHAGCIFGRRTTSVHRIYAKRRH